MRVRRTPFSRAHSRLTLPSTRPLLWAMFMRTILLLTTLWTAGAFAAGEDSLQRRADAFLEGYNGIYQGLYTVAAEATWLSMTDVTPEHTGRRIGAEQAKAAFVGGTYVIDQARAFLRQTNQLDALTVRQLQAILLLAAEGVTKVYEVGPGAVLGGLTRQIDASMEVVKWDA